MLKLSYNIIYIYIKHFPFENNLTLYIEFDLDYNNVGILCMLKQF